MSYSTIKKCIVCKKVQSRAKCFYICAESLDGLFPVCKDCFDAGRFMPWQIAEVKAQLRESALRFLVAPLIAPEMADFSPGREVWRLVPGYGERYEASSEGRLRRVKGKRPNERLPRLLSVFPGDGGYIRTAIMRDDGTCYKPGVHQLVAEAFLGPCPEGAEVNHRDLDKTNNRPGNLEYTTHQGNINHARQNRTSWGIRQSRSPDQLLLFTED